MYIKHRAQYGLCEWCVFKGHLRPLAGSVAGQWESIVPVPGTF